MTCKFYLPVQRDYWRNISPGLNEINDDDKLRGVCFGPEGSEPIFFTFIPAGRLCPPISLMCRDIYDGIQFDKELMFTDIKTNPLPFVSFIYPASRLGLFQFFKDARQFVLPHIIPIKISSIHCHINACRQSLGKGKGATQVK